MVSLFRVPNTRLIETVVDIIVDLVIVVIVDEVAVDVLVEIAKRMRVVAKVLLVIINVLIGGVSLDVEIIESPKVVTMVDRNLRIRTE